MRMGNAMGNRAACGARGVLEFELDGGAAVGGNPRNARPPEIFHLPSLFRGEF
jgi:hypothetical protein